MKCLSKLRESNMEDKIMFLLTCSSKSEKTGLGKFYFPTTFSHWKHYLFLILLLFLLFIYLFIFILNFLCDNFSVTSPCKLATFQLSGDAVWVCSGVTKPRDNFGAGSIFCSCMSVLLISPQELIVTGIQWSPAQSQL